MFVKIHVIIVAKTKPNVPLANCKIRVAIVSSIPVFSRTPPNDSAHTTKETVHNILSNPPRVNKSSTATTPVCD